jgi:nitrite reductase (NADH) small subunit
VTVAEVVDTDTTYCLGSIDQIPEGEGRNFLLGRVPVAVFRMRDGSVYATQARCTHTGGPLADGLTGGTTLVCPLHAYKFNLTNGQPGPGNDCKAIKTYPASVDADGNVFVSTTPQKL